MDGEWLGEGRHACMHIWIDTCMHAHMGRYMHACTGRYEDGWTEGWRMDGCVDR